MLRSRYLDRKKRGEPTSMAEVIAQDPEFQPKLEACWAYLKEDSRRYAEFFTTKYTYKINVVGETVTWIREDRTDAQKDDPLPGPTA